eukprot:gene1434-32807_t
MHFPRAQERVIQELDSKADSADTWRRTDSSRSGNGDRRREGPRPTNRDGGGVGAGQHRPSGGQPGSGGPNTPDGRHPARPTDQHRGTDYVRQRHRNSRPRQHLDADSSHSHDSHTQAPRQHQQHGAGPRSVAATAPGRKEFSGQPSPGLVQEEKAVDDLPPQTVTPSLTSYADSPEVAVGESAKPRTPVWGAAAGSLANRLKGSTSSSPVATGTTPPPATSEPAVEATTPQPSGIMQNIGKTVAQKSSLHLSARTSSPSISSPTPAAEREHTATNAPGPIKTIQPQTTAAPSAASGVDCNVTPPTQGPTELAVFSAAGVAAPSPADTAPSASSPTRGLHPQPRVHQSHAPGASSMTDLGEGSPAEAVVPAAEPTDSKSFASIASAPPDRPANVWAANGGTAAKFAGRGASSSQPSRVPAGPMASPPQGSKAAPGFPCQQPQASINSQQGTVARPEPAMTQIPGQAATELLIASSAPTTDVGTTPTSEPSKAPEVATPNVSVQITKQLDQSEQPYPSIPEGLGHAAPATESMGVTHTSPAQKSPADPQSATVIEVELTPQPLEAESKDQASASPVCPAPQANTDASNQLSPAMTPPKKAAPPDKPISWATRASEAVTAAHRATAAQHGTAALHQQRTPASPAVGNPPLSPGTPLQSRSRSGEDNKRGAGAPAAPWQPKRGGRRGTGDNAGQRHQYGRPENPPLQQRRSGGGASQGGASFHSATSSICNSPRKADQVSMFHPEALATVAPVHYHDSASSTPISTAANNAVCAVDTPPEEVSSQGPSSLPVEQAGAEDLELAGHLETTTPCTPSSAPPNEAEPVASDSGRDIADLPASPLIPAADSESASTLSPDLPPTAQQVEPTASTEDAEEGGEGTVAGSNPWDALADSAPLTNGGSSQVGGGSAAVDAQKLEPEEALRLLCNSAPDGTSRHQGAALEPRGFTNTGNSCFVNSTLQALLACGPFCGLMQQLRTALPLLSHSESPTLHGLALLAAEFEPAKAVGAPAAPSSTTGESDSAAGLGEPSDTDSSQQQSADNEVWQVKVTRKGRGASSQKDAAKSSPVSAKSQKGSNAANQKGTVAAVTVPVGKKALSMVIQGGQPLIPSMLNEVIRKFSPRQAAAADKPLALVAEAGSADGKPSMAQRIAMKASQNAGSTHEQEQEDAQEFFQFIVDSAHEELMLLKKAHAATEQEGAGAGNGIAGDDEEEWSQVGKKNKSAVTRQVGGSQAQDPSHCQSRVSTIFRGSLRSTVRAPGSKPSATIQPFTMLHLDILPVHVSSVETALTQYCAHEEVEFKAEGASTATRAQKGVALYRLPEVLVLHISRFEYRSSGVHKIHKPIDFDFTLRLRKPVLSEDCPDCRGVAEFRLVATVSHHGRNAAGGHYTADAVQHNGQWLHFNDAAVEVVSKDTVLSEKPYLLFYQRMH